MVAIVECPRCSLACRRAPRGLRRASGGQRQSTQRLDRRHRRPREPGRRRARRRSAVSRRTSIALAAESVVFENAVVATPLCTPSRNAFLTGRWPHAIGVTQLHSELPLGTPTLATLFQNAGYATAAIGKMHWYRGRLGKRDVRLRAPTPTARSGKRGLSEEERAIWQAREASWNRLGHFIRRPLQPGRRAARDRTRTAAGFLSRRRDVALHRRCQGASVSRDLQLLRAACAVHVSGELCGSRAGGEHHAAAFRHRGYAREPFPGSPRATRTRRRATDRSAKNGSAA